ncbi:MAG: M24 family metallopeptidase [Candidatus Aminicenantes bacterium]|nr:M24 family metallopeptidase [Candidatus Aminicenantes bacterium]
MNIEKIQQVLREKNIDGWLLYDFHNRDMIAYHILGLPTGKISSRRWFYFIPALGEPQKLAHRVEPDKLDSLPGEKTMYLAWEELHSSLKSILGGAKKIAMQYSPLQHIPLVSIVDGGLIDLLRSFGHEIVTSADLVQLFEASIDETGYNLHKKAAQLVNEVKNQAFEEIRKAIADKKELTEYALARFIEEKFKENTMTNNEEIPIVGIDDHPANPHFEPTPDNTYVFKTGSKVLIDLWAKMEEPGGIFADITWCGFIGDKPPEKYVEIFDTVMRARDRAVEFIQEKFKGGQSCFGWEVDDACRKVIQDAGYGKLFMHRTGHSIGDEVHGNGVNIDNLETKDERELIPGNCFSIEPGIYFEGEMAARSEINVFITHQGEVEVTTEKQTELVKI